MERRSERERLEALHVGLFLPKGGTEPRSATAFNLDSLFR